MADMFTVYGFEESTYVRTVRMVLAEKGAEHDLVPVNIMEGEGAQPEHLARHPFGKIPVLDHGDLRLFETGTITRYLNDTLPGIHLWPGLRRFIIEGLDAGGKGDTVAGRWAVQPLCLSMTVSVVAPAFVLGHLLLYRGIFGFWLLDLFEGFAGAVGAI